jgi:hypothetical protein
MLQRNRSRAWDKIIGMMQSHWVGPTVWELHRTVEIQQEWIELLTTEIERRH